MACGTNSGCDAALRPHGSARVARAGGAKGAPSGREATRPHGRPCGAPRVGSVIEGIETINRGSHSPIYTYHADSSKSRGPRRSCGSRSFGSPSDGPRSSRSPPIVATRGPLQSARFPSNGDGTSWKNSTIAARSRRFYRGIVGDSSPIDRQAIDEALASRLTPDRGPIVAKITAEIGVSLRLI